MRTFGKQSAGGNFSNNSLYDHLKKKSISLPEEKTQSNLVVPHVLLGNEAYPSKTYLTLSKKDLQKEEEVFN